DVAARPPMEKLAARNRDTVLGLLADQLRMERAGVSLCEAALSRVQASEDVLVLRAGPALIRVRAAEHEHAVWLEGRLAARGAPGRLPGPEVPPTSATAALLATARDPSSGIAAVCRALLDHALLDHAGWNLLIDLATEAEDEAAHEQLRGRLDEENEHL